MIARFLVGGELLLVAAIVTGLLVLEGFRRLSRCCMSARTLVADVARGDQVQPQTPPGHPETVRDICPGQVAYERIVGELRHDGIATAGKEAGRVR